MEYSDLTPGEHRFRVRAIDLAGNVEHPPLTRTFTIGMDATPPETTILTGPPATVPDDWASFEFSSNELDATFECAIDGEPFEECFNPAQYVELEPGEHTFQVRAVDSSLNPDPTPGDLDVDLRAREPDARDDDRQPPDEPVDEHHRRLPVRLGRARDRVRVRARRRAVRVLRVAVPDRGPAARRAHACSCARST